MQQKETVSSVFSFIFVDQDLKTPNFYLNKNTVHSVIGNWSPSLCYLLVDGKALSAEDR